MTLGLIVSSKQEANRLLSQISVKKKLKLDTFDVYYFCINKHEFFMIICDKNRQSAAKATSQLIKKIKPVLIISFGTSGALNEDIHTGDVIYANAVTTIDNAVFDQFIVLTSAFTNIRQHILNTLLTNKVRFFIGTIISINSSDALSDFSKVKFMHPVLDLETMAIAQVAKYEHIQLVVLHGITHNFANKSNATIHMVFDYYWHFNKVAAIRLLLSNPKIMFSLVKYFKNKRLASKKLIESLLSLLESLNISINDYRVEYQI